MPVKEQRKPGELLRQLKAIRAKCLDCCCGSSRFNVPQRF